MGIDVLNDGAEGIAAPGEEHDLEGRDGRSRSQAGQYDALGAGGEERISGPLAQGRSSTVGGRAIHLNCVPGFILQGHQRGALRAGGDVEEP